MMDAMKDARWISADTLPETGRKVVAIYGDGSGALLLFRHDGGFLNSDGDDERDEFWDECISTWAYLPDDLEFWCEMRADAPFRLTPEKEAGR